MFAPVASIVVAVFVTLLRWTCRIRFHNDPRADLRGRGANYLFSFLHAHQIGLIIGREEGTGAMVSKSKDGELIVRVLQWSGCVPVRGSNRTRRDRGGRAALHTLVDHVMSGRPAALAVDGPRGPRGRVHKGIALLSQQTGAPVINIVAISRQRWVVSRAWDRLQIPMPFTRIDGYFGEPIFPREGEKLEAYRRRIELSLQALEAEHEPREARFNIQPQESQLMSSEWASDEDADGDVGNRESSAAA